MIYRIVAESYNNDSSNIWDLDYLKLYNQQGELLLNSNLLASSGEYDTNQFAAKNVFNYEDRNLIWGGRRKNNTEKFFLEFETNDKIAIITIKQTFNHRIKGDILIQFKHKDDYFTVKKVKHCQDILEISVCLLKHLSSNEAEKNYYAKKEQQVEEFNTFKEQDFITTPSQEPIIKPHDCSIKKLCYKEKTVYKPIESFYNVINLDGLYILATKQVEEMVLIECAQFVAEIVPLNIRKAFSKFISPLWSKDKGPLRLIIFDNRCNQQMGMIPELDFNENLTGRNQVSCPFICTSREDFTGGIGNSWPKGKLTMHELMHGIDMVIRQQIDPYFNDQVYQLYMKSKHLYKTANGKPLYASTNRDEYLAEAFIICLNLCERNKSSDYFLADLYSKEKIIEKDPDIVKLIGKYLNI